MVKYSPIIASLLLIGQVWAQAPQPPAIPAAPAKPAVTYTDIQLLETVGWFVAKQAQLSGLGFDAAQVAAIQKGFALSVEGKDSPYPIETVGPQVQTFMQNRIQAAQQKGESEAKGKEASYFAELKKKPGIKSTASGLHYEIIEQGSADKPKGTDLVTVDYEGKLLNGTVFDSSKQRGPATFGLNGVIAGWTEGMQLIGVGGKVRLHVPYTLAYGPQSKPTIPAFSTLVFEVTLISKKAAPDQATQGMPPGMQIQQVPPQPVAK